MTAPKWILLVHLDVSSTTLKRQIAFKSTYIYHVKKPLITLQLPHALSLSLLAMDGHLRLPLSQQQLICPISIMTSALGGALAIATFATRHL